MVKYHHFALLSNQAATKTRLGWWLLIIWYSGLNHSFRLEFVCRLAEMFLPVPLPLPLLLSLQHHQRGIVYFFPAIEKKQESPLGILTGHSDPPHPQVNAIPYFYVAEYTSRWLWHNILILALLDDVMFFILLKKLKSKLNSEVELRCKLAHNWECWYWDDEIFTGVPRPWIQTRV